MNAVSFVGCFVLAIDLCSIAVANEAPCEACRRRSMSKLASLKRSGRAGSFGAATYTHDPATGARVAQYLRLPAIQPLEDERIVTSRYHRTRTNMRGTDGSSETYYEIQSWGNGRGGIDAEWERFHDAWKESFLQGGYYNQGYGYGNPGQFGNGYGGQPYGYGYPGYGGNGGFPGIGNGGPYWGNQPWQNGSGNHNHNEHDHHGDGGHDDGHGHGGYDD